MIPIALALTVALLAGCATTAPQTPAAVAAVAPQTAPAPASAAAAGPQAAARPPAAPGLWRRDPRPRAARRPLPWSSRTPSRSTACSRSGRRTTSSGSNSRRRTSTSRSSCRPRSSRHRRGLLFGGLMGFAGTARRRGRVPACAQPGAAGRRATLEVSPRPARPRRARWRRPSPSLLASAPGGQPAAPGAQVGAGRGQRPLPQRPARAWACSCSAPTARATASTRATRRSPRCAAARRSAGAGDAEPLRRRQHRRAAARRAARRAGAQRAAVVPDARSLFMTLHYSLAQLPTQPMAGARGRSTHRALHARASSTSATTSRATRASACQPLAAGEEGPAAASCPSRSSRSPSGSTATSR